MSARRRIARRALTLLLVPLVLGACGGATTPVTAPAAASPTIGPAHDVSSPVTLSLVSPKSDEIVVGSTAHVALTMTGGAITSAYSTHVSPTVGHIHLYLNGQLVSMSYQTATDIPVDPGATYSLYAEWVASDHGSFTPRDVTRKIYFSVAP